MEKTNLIYFESFRNEIFKEMNILENLNSCKPVTAQGMMFKTKCIINNNKPVTLNETNSMVGAMSRVATQDVGINQIYEYFNKVIAKDRTRFGLALAFETIYEHSKSDPMADVMCANICEALQLDDSEILESISNGCLDSVARNNQIVNYIVCECKKQVFENGKDAQVGEFSVKTPISFVEESNDKLHFRINNSIFAIDDNELVESVVPSAVFKIVSDILEQCTYNKVNECFEFSMLNAKYSIKDGSIIQCYEGKELEYTPSQLIENVNESISKGHCGKENAMKVDSIIALNTHNKSIVSLSNMRVVTNNRLHESFLFVEHEGKSYLSVLESKRYIKSTQKFDSIQEGVKRMYEMTQFDISTNFNESIEAEKTQDMQKAKDIKMYNESIADLKDKLEVLKAEMQMCESGSDAYNILNPTYKVVCEELESLKSNLKKLQ